MHSSDNDSMESDPNEDSFNSGPSTFNLRITTTSATIPAAIVDHQQPPHKPSRTVTSGAPPSNLCNLPTFVAASVRSYPPSNYCAPNIAHLEAEILKQGCDITNLSTHFGDLHAKLLPFYNLLAKEGE